ncbi:MAG: nuclease-related domain-containing protein [Gammaproteobacteria bacterium]
MIDLIKEVCGLFRNILCWFWESRKDFKPAYRVKFGKHKSKVHPLKQGALNRPGARTHSKSIGLALTLFNLAIFALFLIVILILSANSAGGLNTFLAYAAGFCIVCIIVAAPVLAYQTDNHFLGYLGERAVANELDKLGRPQWRVYHDFDSGYGNIDHIIVCLKGVFCVETKTLRKERDESETLTFKDGALWRGERKFAKSDPIKQSRRNAARLHKYLSEECVKSASGEAIPFIPSIIAFPGWRVEIMHGHHDKGIIPCNPKQIGTIFPKRDDAVSVKMFGKICEAIEKKNRIDVNDIS